MTKRELLENDVFKSMSDDTEIVFGTNAELGRCVPLNALNLSAVRQCVNAPEQGDVLFTPKYKNALVIDAVPYWYLKDAYNITFNEL